ncbi:MAG: hypothetical protein NWE87_00185 [Candidatus Bathyarchaeota archaeon]|nr:hypothetical protein [Candidatus Bathyarchaeota archaeon]
MKMYFQPIDEMSLRHLFSSRYAEDILKMSYLGPVLNSSGTPETSPDCLILDKREKQWRILRCEFKYVPSSEEDFRDNGEFNIAILWGIARPLTRQELQKELLTQNGCHEILVLSEYKAFSNLDKYHIPSSKEFNKIDELRRVILERDYPSVFSAFIAAKIYPEEFRMDNMVNALANRFPEVKRMQPRGRANVVSALIQTEPPLIRWLHGRIYCWNDDINATSAAREIEHIIRTRFRKDISGSDIIESFRKGP